jgi:uncharacterized protein YlaI
MNEKCWLCGKSGKITKHHVIPKYMNPKKNTTIPLCRECHNKLHIGIDNIAAHREIIYFDKVKKNGKTKVQGRINNGKVIFPDRKAKIDVKPKRYYDVEVHQIRNCAYARDIKPLGFFDKLNYKTHSVMRKM